MKSKIRGEFHSLKMTQENINGRDIFLKFEKRFMKQFKK